MNPQSDIIVNAEAILENLTHTLLYEGYALFPYHRTAVKNQKPIPFGVVFPEAYHQCNAHAHSIMQTQCIVHGSNESRVSITVRFLQLKKIELWKYNVHAKVDENVFTPVHHLHINGISYQAGWQTIEHKIVSGDLQISSLINATKLLSISVDKMEEHISITDENNEVAATQTSSVSAITGSVIIEASPIEGRQDAFTITVKIVNTSPVENTVSINRDEVLSQCYLSTHTVLQTSNATFISHQNPDENWKPAIEACQNKNSWPILIDETDTTLLCSPIILYDHPQINPLSHGDLFDSTEIEEALLLHVNLLSDEEKLRIAQNDDKLRHMLQKVSAITPEELINFHSGLKETENQIIQTKKLKL